VWVVRYEPFVAVEFIGMETNAKEQKLNRGGLISSFTVVLPDIGDNLAYRHGLHFSCEEVYPNRNR